MRLFRKKPKKTVMVLQGDVATATRAMYQGQKSLPRIDCKFEVKGSDPDTGEHFDEITIELDLYEASKFANQLLSSIKAATPEAPRSARQVPWD